MKLSELIDRCAALKAEHGDVTVCCTAEYELPVDEVLDERHIEVLLADSRFRCAEGVTGTYVLIGGRPQQDGK